MDHDFQANRHESSTSTSSSTPSSSSPRSAQDKPSINLPTVKVEMITTFPSASSPNLLQNATFLSPVDTQPPRRRHSSELPQRPSSAPPTTTTFDDVFRDDYQRKSLTPTTNSFRNRTTSFADGAGVGGPVKPTPLLLRPTTFWRNTRRSGVTAASYSPSSHLIRRSTFIAAGLTLDKPVADLSALGVESRVGVIVLPSDISI
ncbi:hypothetical protein EIP91_001858 [Steccherinum ochraceum]|uniref:Uncharacterized protein n=1 Tax=Steccherinum ochraceum TaxID=92696 RepID=A0A4R0RD61_9APHY|nr:hypothetical protein EIP91_001858 [Steccherinum ochraceum]